MSINHQILAFCSKNRPMRALIFFFLLVTTSGFSQQQYADVIIDAYYSGVNPNFDDFYGAKNNTDLILVDPSVCLGDNPWFVCVPTGSYIVVGFTDNLVFDAPGQKDLFIQEVGAADELAEIYVSSDFGATFTYFGIINGGSTNGLDLADIGFTGLVNAVKIVGLDKKGSAPGFDIARIYGLKGANCTANADTLFPNLCLDDELILDSVGGIWEPPTFLDADYILIDTGHFVLQRVVEDSIDVCPNDTALVEFYIRPCDCMGTPYGKFELDACNLCLDPADSLFGISCLDCMGVPNGTAITDICGQCLQPDDPNICTAEKLVYIPNVFSPNSDGVNDVFDVQVRNGVEAEVLEYSIYGRWGQLVFQQQNFPIRSSNHWWDGRIGRGRIGLGVYLYHIRIRLSSGEELDYAGDVTIGR